MLYRLLGLYSSPSESEGADRVVWEEKDTPPEWIPSFPTSIPAWEAQQNRFLELYRQAYARNMERHRQIMLAYMGLFTPLTPLTPTTQKTADDE